MTNQELGLHFGAISKPIAEQLEAQGFKTARDFQTYADAITRIHVCGFLTESETKKARERLLKEIAKNVEPIGESE